MGKLYNEAQIKKAIEYGCNYLKMDRGEIPYMGEDEFVKLLFSIDLPSNDEIAKQSKIHSHEEYSFLTNATQNQKRLSFYNGAKWMLDKIGGNNE
jgi:hypothetical protein